MRLSLTARIVLPFLALSALACAVLVWAAAAGARRAVEDRALAQARDMTRLFAGTGFALNPAMLAHVKSAMGTDIIDVSGGSVRGATLDRAEAEALAKAADPRRPFAGAGRFRLVAITDREVSVVYAFDAAALDSAKTEAARPLLLLSAGAFLGVLVVGLLLGHALLRPLGAILAGAERVAAGDASRDVEVRTGDEFETLAASFNRMQAALRRQREDERWAAAGRVAAGVAHDLRNPLTGLQMMVQMLEREEKDGKRRETLAMMLTEIKRLERAVRELLDLAAPETPRPEPVDLGAVAREALDLFRGQAAHRGVALAQEGESPSALADRGRARRVLDNLVANALDATPAGGRVAVRLGRAADARPTLAVVDTGAGIPEAVRAKLFEPFSSDKPGGTGLGLATVKRLVEEMGGAVVVETGAGGTTITVTLPKTG
jgi:signal transduction histidine kinase